LIRVGRLEVCRSSLRPLQPRYSTAGRCKHVCHRQGRRLEAEAIALILAPLSLPATTCFVFATNFALQLINPLDIVVVDRTN
jgi:hypothetical protein